MNKSQRRHFSMGGYAPVWFDNFLEFTEPNPLSDLDVREIKNGNFPVDTFAFSEENAMEGEYFPMYCYQDFPDFNSVRLYFSEMFIRYDKTREAPCE